MFITREYNPRGLYKVRIFDPVKNKFVVVVVDDRIPCKKGSKKPRFMNPNGNELWAIILEKAYAKFCGSYSALDGGVNACDSSCMLMFLIFCMLLTVKLHVSFHSLYCGDGIALQVTMSFS
jgi:hypothetical protein